MHTPSRITAVLGATNTGKTHYAVERMLARVSGVIGLPLRLLAREIYDKICAQKGAAACALLTGEEKIIPPHARYFVCTLEAMPMDDIKAGKFACVIIDEVQMIAHKERGHIFTNRLLYARGVEETLLLGADTARQIIKTLVPKARFTVRQRFSILSYTGPAKITRLPKRSIIVAFSANEVYAIAELACRTYGGAALVMGGLSPRTRNAQAALYQNGEVDYMVATDAIGMGLNLDADHIAFASLRKFDGRTKRYLYASEIAQIAGRAGRFRRNGSFGTTGRCLPLDEDIVTRIENHNFETLPYAEWRNTRLDYTSIDTLQNSLAAAPAKPMLRRAAPAPDETALARLLKTHDITRHIHASTDVRRLWEMCQVPDFRNLGPEAHTRLLEEIFLCLEDNNGSLTASYMEKNIRRLDHHEGSVEILASRLANIRTWTYIAHKHAWVKNTKNWINYTRDVEDRLSDALHTKLMQRFVDRRTSALLKGIGANTHMDATITPSGEVIAQGHAIGHLKGLLFVPDEAAAGLEAKAVQAAAALALAPEIDRKLIQIAGSDHGALSLSNSGEIIWGGDVIGKLLVGDALLAPKACLIGGELGSPVLCDQAIGRISDFLRMEISQQMESLLSLKEFTQDPKSFQGARALAHVLYENHGAVERLDHMELIKNTDKIARGYLRNKSAQFGYHQVFLRDLLKPAPARLMSLLFAFAWDKDGGGHGKPFLPLNGMSSTPNDNQYSEQALNKAGYTRRGPRIIRFDMLARLAQMILQAIEEGGGKQFRVAQEMLALLGCSFEDFEGILTVLGYKKITKELTPKQLEAETNAMIKAFKTDSQNTAKGQPNKEEQPPKPAAIETPKDTQEKAPKAPANKKDKALSPYRQRPVMDDSDNPIFPTSIDFWQRDFKKKFFKSARKTGVNNEDAASGHSGDNAARRRSGNAKKFAGYANIKPSPGAPTKHRANPKTNPSRPEDSPFAALAGLSFDSSGKKKGR